MKSLSRINFDRNQQAGLLLAALSVAVCCLMNGGCEQSGYSASANGNGAKTAAAAVAPEKRSADQVLKDMEAAYKKANTYEDAGKVRLHFERDGKAYEDTLDFAATFVRPNKLRLTCYDVMAVSDGKQFHAAIKSVPNLVLELPSPEVLTVDDVVRDRQIFDTLRQGPAGPPVQLPFLMAENTLPQLLQDAMQPPKLAAPEVVDDRPCNRVDIDTADGTLTLWIDQKENLIRRINLPTADFKKQLEQDGGSPVKNVALSIDFYNAQINHPVPDVAFKFEIPADAKVANSLIPEVPPANIAPATEPTAFTLTKLWSAGEVKDPGNILVVDGPGGETRILVFDGWRTVSEIDHEGKVVARHELEIAEDSILCFLRTATDRQGKRYYVASVAGQKQCHVFDENWKRILSYPRAEVQLADLDGSGKPQLCVSYWGDVGVQGAALDGNRLWKNQSLQFVLRTAATDADASGHRRLLCTHSRGTIIPLDSTGKADKEISIPDRHVYYVVSADLEGAGHDAYLALAGTVVNDNTAVGFNLDGKELWNYALPPGVHGRPIELVTTADFTGDASRQWVIAGPDGSIHILSADGKPLEKFNSGSALSGIGATKFGDQHVLLLSKVLDKPDGDVKGSLEAWLVETK
jgi:outer membrane lipoprotein-sorting protein